MPGLAGSKAWATLYGRYGGATRSAVARFETEVMGKPDSDGSAIAAPTLRALLQHQPELKRAVREAVAGTDAADAATLAERARTAERERRKSAALKLWRQVLRLAPEDYEANRAVGMALSYKDEFEAAMPHLVAALRTRPRDYTLNHYAGINQKLRADRLPESALAQKESLWSEATTFCETARAAFAAQRAPGARKPKPSWSDRFFFIHCCEAYEGIGRREDKRACFDEAHSAQIWRTVGQRPGNYDETLTARPWWEVGQLGASAPDVRLLRSEPNTHLHVKASAWSA